MKVWDRARIELATPGSAVRHPSIYLKTGGDEGGSKEPPAPPLDQPLHEDLTLTCWMFSCATSLPLYQIDFLFFV